MRCGSRRQGPSSALSVLRPRLRSCAGPTKKNRWSLAGTPEERAEQRRVHRPSSGSGIADGQDPGTAANAHETMIDQPASPAALAISSTLAIGGAALFARRASASARLAWLDPGRPVGAEDPQSPHQRRGAHVSARHPAQRRARLCRTGGRTSGPTWRFEPAI